MRACMMSLCACVCACVCVCLKEWRRVHAKGAGSSEGKDDQRREIES